ncbi:hypothetical protein QP162_06025 [Sphingomonas aurantiaca]|uniref:hypothetical protein n=1 Tax=Sphingomonas aurantiaca TaxID=185949 RepID=UPI002FDF5901
MFGSKPSTLICATNANFANVPSRVVAGVSMIWRSLSAAYHQDLASADILQPVQYIAAWRV